MSDEPKPVGRFDWERLVMRAEMPTHLKALALVIAAHANNNGTGVRVGRKLLANILDTSERTAEVNRNTLVALGWLTLVKRGGGRGGEGRTNLYRLTDPGIAALVFRLDPDGNRVIERKIGKRPPQRIDAKPTSPQKPVDNPDPADLEPRNEAKPTSHENDFQAKPTTDWSEAHFALPLLTTKPLLLPLGDPPQFAATTAVEKPNGANGIDPPRAPPAKRAATRTQTRKRKKR